MLRRFSPLAKLIFQTDGIFVTPSAPSLIIERQLAFTLEVFARHNGILNAYVAYRRFRRLDSVDQQKLPIPFTMERTGTALLLVGNRILICSPSLVIEAYRLANLANKCSYVRGSPSATHIKDAMQRMGIMDVSHYSKSVPCITNVLAREYGLEVRSYAKLSIRQFAVQAEELCRRGLLTVPVGTAEFGDLKRCMPVCPDYGYSRGTPIDRYYLDRFVTEIREQVTGIALEIGGQKHNQARYGFEAVSDYCTMDLDERNHPDVIADVHCPTACGDESVDSVILFNVLEHCSEPWVVVQNIYRWLKTGGKVFCMVPNTQRIHRDPKDFWRILPDAFESLFRPFQILRLVSYGNLLASVAALSGIAAEELAVDDLNHCDPRYPVITCIVASKA